MDPKLLRNFLLFMFVFEACIIGALVAGTSGSWLKGAGVGLLAFVFPLTLLPITIVGVAGLARWSELARAFPPVEPGADAAPPKLASMGVRWAWLSFNNCIRVVVDDEHLHLAFALPFAPTYPTSIPWASVLDITEGRFRARLDLAAGPRLWLPKALVRRELEIRATPLTGEGRDAAPA